MTYHRANHEDLRRRIAAVNPELLERTQLRLWRNRPKRLWQELARVDPKLATWFSAYVASGSGPRPRIVTDRPDRYYMERAMVERLAGEDNDERERLLRLLSELWDLVPYAMDGSARIEALSCLRPRTRFARRHFDEIRALALELGAQGSKQLPFVRVPLGLRGEEGPLVPTVVLARRLPRAEDQDLIELADALRNPRLVRLAKNYGPPRFLRRLGDSSSLAVRILLLSGYLSLSRLPSWRTLGDTWDVVDELCERMEQNDHDPLAAINGCPQVVIREEAIEALEVRRELLYTRLCLAGRRSRSAWNSCYRGCAGLKEALRALHPEADRILVERLPWFPPPERTRRRQGIEDDDQQLDLDAQAKLFVFGVGVLAEDPDLLRTWVVLWTTMCRPKESGPFACDFVPFGSAYVIYRERDIAKAGAAERYISQAAVAVTGINRSWFKRRPSPEQTKQPDYEEQARVAEAACQKVRDAWERHTGNVLPDRTAYFIRKAGADRLRWGLSGRFYALSRVLGHLSDVSDWTYTFLSRTEQKEVQTKIAQHLEGLLP